MLFKQKRQTLTVKELAEELHNSSLSSYSHPDTRSGWDWSDYRETVAKELLERCEIYKKR